MRENKCRKRIVICTPTMRFGGAERVVSILSGELAERFESVEILLYFDEEIRYDLNPSVKVTVAERETHTKGKIRNLFWIRGYLRRNADTVISFLAPFNMLILVAAMGLPCRKIVADRSAPGKVPANVWMRRVRNFLYRFADAVVVQTKGSYDYFSPEIRQKTRIIYNPTSVKGTDIGLALQAKKQDTVVCVGRMMPVKNPGMLLNAFAAFHRDYPSYRLVWYGDGELREEMEKQAAEKGLTDCISLPGNRKDILQEIAGARMFVMTSNYEGMPNALIEAMCIGLPCVCTRVDGALELIEQGKNGFLVEIGDADACREAMVRLAADENLAQSIGEQAAAMAKRLNVENIVGQWVEIL